MVDSVLSVGLQGIQAGVASANQAARDIAAATTVEFPQDPATATTDSTVDITTAAVALKASEHQVAASAAVIRTADEMIGTLVDIKA